MAHDRHRHHVSGFFGAAGALAAVTMTLVAGGNGIDDSYGYSNGGGNPANTFSGSSLTPGTDNHGYTIDSIYDANDGLGTTAATYELEGNHTGNQFTSIAINGNTFARTSFDTPNGVYDAGTNSTKWAYSGHLWGLSAPGTYLVTIT